MFSRSVIPLTFAAVLILSAPASAATGTAGPSATPLILEVALAIVASIALALRRPAARLAAATRRKITPAARRQAASARARGV
jgi:hypothetical protein